MAAGFLFGGGAGGVGGVQIGAGGAAAGAWLLAVAALTDAAGAPWGAGASRLGVAGWRGFLVVLDLDAQLLEGLLDLDHAGDLVAGWRPVVEGVPLGEEGEGGGLILAVVAVAVLIHLLTDAAETRRLCSTW